MKSFHNAMAVFFNRFGGLVGRLMIVPIFAGAAYNKIINFSQTKGYMTSKMSALPDGLITFLLIGAIIFLVAGSALLAVGWQTRLGALLLAIFLISVTPIFHAFWAVEADQFRMQFLSFQKNLAILGGLFVILACGAGPISFDERSKSNVKTT